MIKRYIKSLFSFLVIVLFVLGIFTISSAATSQGEAEEFGSPELEIKISRFGLTLKWDDVPDAASYRIWKTESGKTNLICETKAHMWLDTEVTSGSSLRYAVTSVDKNGNESDPIWQYARFLSKPDLQATEVLAGFRLEWTAVDGAAEYEVFRKNSNGTTEHLTTTSITSYTDATASPIEDYVYSVTAVRGNYRSAAASCVPIKLEEVPEELGGVPEGFEVSVFGQSGAGRDLLVYKWGNGENVLLMTFALHGWEDSFPRDGRAHVYTAYRLMNSVPDWDAENWTIYIVPLANPDGLLDGSGNYGPGRCTTMMYDSNGNLVEGGVDINRSFPSYWYRHYSGRNNTGSAPLSCPEAEALCKLMEDCKGEGKNVYIDVHGWTNQIIPASWGWYEYWAFASRFPSCSTVYGGTASGYAAAHAAYLGYSSGLFEFPEWHYRLTTFVQSNLPDKFARSVQDIVEYYN